MLGLLGLGAIGADLAFNGGNTIGGFFEPVTDYLSGYTGANSAQRFAIENALIQQSMTQSNMKLQNKYNLQNMALTDRYQRQLMADTPSIQVEALRRAGLNPLFAVDKGFNSAQTAVHSSTPIPSGPSIASPQVVPQLSNVANVVSQAFGVGGQMASILLQGAQSRAADAASAESAARTLKTMKEADALSPDLERKVKSQVGDAAELSSQAKAVDTVAHFGSAAASAYSAKKASDVARAVISRGGKIKVAKKLAAQVVNRSSASSALQAVKFLRNFGLLGTALGVGAGVGTLHFNDLKKRSGEEIKIRNKLRASSQGYGFLW